MRDTIDMAREAGIEFQRNVGLLGRENISTTGSQSLEKIERLVALVRADERETRSMRWDELIAKAVEAEREVCARVCDALHYEVDAYGAQCAAAIRARKETK